MGEEEKGVEEEEEETHAREHWSLCYQVFIKTKQINKRTGKQTNKTKRVDYTT
jgi:hypothetical protein